MKFGIGVVLCVSRFVTRLLQTVQKFALPNVNAIKDSFVMRVAIVLHGKNALKIMSALTMKYGTILLKLA